MGRQLAISLTVPQSQFVLCPDPFPAIVAGFGAGKTHSLTTRLIIRKLLNPKGTVGYYAPTFDLVKLVGMDKFEELLEANGLSYKLNKNEKTIQVAGNGRFIFRTMENPARIVGFETSDAGVDELDTLKKEHASAAWKKIIARNREKVRVDGGRNSVAVATTPEGFRFVYEQWHKAPKAGYTLVRASTYSNEQNLDKDYIPNLLADYPPALISAYLNGEFVNLTSGAVYPEFDRRLNRTSRTIQPSDLVLHLGMDFNVGKMASVVYVLDQDGPKAVDEFVDLRDTPAMIEAIKTRYGSRHRITVYPDASGNNTSSKSASISDISQLRQAGFTVLCNATNPRVKDRLSALNVQILNVAGQRRLLVNTDRCPKFTDALEQQVYASSGEPDKSGGHDHVNDAGGYPIAYLFPVRHAVERAKIIGG